MLKLESVVPEFRKKENQRNHVIKWFKQAIREADVRKKCIDRSVLYFNWM